MNNHWQQSPGLSLNKRCCFISSEGSNILERPNKDNTILEGLNFIDHGDIEDCSTNGTASAY